MLQPFMCVELLDKVYMKIMTRHKRVVLPDHSCAFHVEQVFDSRLTILCIHNGATDMWWQHLAQNKLLDCRMTAETAKAALSHVFG